MYIIKICVTIVVTYLQTAFGVVKLNCKKLKGDFAERRINVMIKIKLGIVDHDRVYLDRISKYFNNNYKNQVEVYSFTDESTVTEAVRQNKINVLMAAQDIEIRTDRLADFCMFAYFIDSKMIDTYSDYHAICKFQRADLIYKQILGLYSEKLADKVKYKNSGARKSEISLLVSGFDGAGATTSAAAYARYLAAKGRKTLFLNLKQFGNIENIFEASGKGSFTDAIFAIKSRKVNMTLKLESIVKQSDDGVYFYDRCRDVLDYTEINLDELETLLDEMSGSFGYHNIVVVTDFYFCDSLIYLMEQAKEVIIVCDNRKTSQVQLERRTSAIKSLDNRKNLNVSDKVRLIFNKTINASIFRTDFPVIGIQPELEMYDDKEIVKEMAFSGIFDKMNSVRKQGTIA